MPVTYLITFTVAYCSIIYELLMAQTLSALMGNTVLRYSITIGIYLASLGIGAMLCQKSDEQDCARRLVRIEIWLSVVGGLAVLILSSLDVVHRFLGTNNLFYIAALGFDFRPALFFTLSHGVIVVIGVLSGFEIPLLMALGESKRPNTMNLVLGVDYFGSLVGSVLFPLILLPKLGLFAVAYLTGLLNAVACGLLLVFTPTKHKFRYARITCSVVAVLLFLLAFTQNTQQFFLKKFYYYKQVKSISSLLSSFENLPRIEEYRSPYQRIHLVNAPADNSQKMIYSQYSEKFAREPDFPEDLWLFLNNQFQISANTEEIYHEFFVHVPIQWTKPPEKALILGAGDGIVLRELLKYRQVKHITLVDIDPKMLHIARHHPDLQTINHNSFADPRVTVIAYDAFLWLQETRQKFDAIYIDFPSPNNYDLAKLYSVEFYWLVKRCLAEKGYVAADLPSGEAGLWDEYYSTLQAAGFHQIRPYDGRLESENEGILKLEKLFLRQAAIEKKNDYGYPVTTNDPDVLRPVFNNLVRESLKSVFQRFIFLQERRQVLNSAFQDYGIPLYVLNESRLKLAGNAQFDDIFKPDRVNSVFRPTMPEFDFFTVSAPY
ncbi:MAG: hypothetical protein Q8P24_03055 [Desulfobacterales bacterium]|nr:hypothetical protein [Desulfobacterales bacterium]